MQRQNQQTAIAVVVGTCIAGIGCIMPWVDLGVRTLSGTAGDGIIVLALCALGLILGVVGTVRKELTRTSGALVTLLGGASIGFGVLALKNIGLKAADLGLGGSIVGSGLYVVLVGAAITTMAGLAGLVERGNQVRVHDAQMTMAVPAPLSVVSSPAERLRELAELRESGLLTPEEFESKRKAILAQL
jgi:hypothetical protein